MTRRALGFRLLEEQPDGEWMKQVARNLTDSVDGFLRDATAHAIFSSNQDGWQAFYWKYPDAPGIMAFSRVGFNATGNQALVSWR